MIQPALHDVIERLFPDAELGLPADAQGTLVQAYGDGAFEVEFSDNEGQLLASRVMRPVDFIVVWQASTGHEVRLPEQVAQIVGLLPEPAGIEVLDFARFLSWRQVKDIVDVSAQ